MKKTADIKCVGGVWLPAHEEHLPKWMRERNEVVDGKLTYQYHKLRAALRWVRPSFDIAVDVGAHCGLWSMHLAKLFATVVAFEPVALHRECFRLNVDATNVVLHGVALGSEPGRVKMHTTPGSSGDTWVDERASDVADGVELCRLDDFGIDERDSDRVDLIKLDCEGYELFALRGGEQLLKGSLPCVIVEQKPGRAQKWGLGETDAVAYLQSLGAKLRAELSGDFILSWDD